MVHRLTRPPPARIPKSSSDVSALVLAAAALDCHVRRFYSLLKSRSRWRMRLRTAYSTRHAIEHIESTTQRIIDGSQRIKVLRIAEGS